MLAVFVGVLVHFVYFMFGFGFYLDQMKINNYVLVNNLRFKTKIEEFSFCFYALSSFKKHYFHTINSQCFLVI